MSKIRFRLSTVFFLLAVAALMLGWYWDHYHSQEPRIVGHWKHPFPGSGYWENLYFKPDGTFRRLVRYREGSEEIEGRFEIVDRNQIQFTFEKHTSSDRGLRALAPDEKKIADCRVMYAFDSMGNLLLINLNSQVAYGRVDEKDECYIPSRNYERGEYTIAPIEQDSRE